MIYHRVYRMAFGRELSISSEVPTVYVLTLGMKMFFGLLVALIKLRRMQVTFAHMSTRFILKSKLKLGRGARLGKHCVIDAMGVEGIHIGSSSKVADYSILKVSGSLSQLGKGIYIGNNVGLSEYTYIGGAGGVVIGDSVIAGQYLSIHPENHIFTCPNVEIRKQGVTREGVKIGSNCWIGAKVTFVDGSEIGNNCVVAAGSVVTKKFPDNVLVGGVPAKILKKIV